MSVSQGLGMVQQGSVHALIYVQDVAVSPTSKIKKGSRNQGLAMGVASLTITPSNPLEQFLLLSCFFNLSSLDIDILVPEGEYCIRRRRRESV